MFFPNLKATFAHMQIPYEDPEREHQERLFLLFSHTDLAERLTGLSLEPNSFRKEPEGKLFACSFLTVSGVPVYLYLRASTFGSPQTEYEQVSAQASFMLHHREAYYYALLLREAWFEWDEEYPRTRLQLPFRRLGYEELLSSLSSLNRTQIPEEYLPLIENYVREIRREYQSFRKPLQVVDSRLRAYACFLHIKEAAMRKWEETDPFPLHLDIRTQLHVQSYRLEEHLLIQRPPYKLSVQGHEVGLYWEAAKAGLFLKVWLPPMHEKTARALHAHIRRQAQPIVSETLPLGRTRGTLKGMDPYHDRHVNVLRIETFNPLSLAEVSDERQIQERAERLAEDLLKAIRLLPRIGTALLSSEK